MISYIIVYIYAQYIIPRPSTCYPWGWPLASPNMETAAWPLVTHCAIRIFCFINISILVESQKTSRSIWIADSLQYLMSWYVIEWWWTYVYIYISIYIYLLYPILQFISYLWYLWCLYLFSDYHRKWNPVGLEFFYWLPLGMVASGDGYFYDMYEPLEHITNHVYIYYIIIYILYNHNHIYIMYVYTIHR